MTPEQIIKIREYINMREYLARQISKIKQIIELQQLQIACKLRRLAMLLMGGYTAGFPETIQDAGYQIEYYRVLIGLI